MSLIKNTTLCTYCPKLCRFSCPVSEAEARETVTPWSKMTLVHLAERGDLPYDEEMVSVLEACCHCGACSEFCAHGNPVGESLAQGRQNASSERSKRYQKNFADTGHVTRKNYDELYGAFHKTRKARLGYLPGCARLKDGKAAMERDLAVLHRALGHVVELVDLPASARCCGYALAADGDKKAAKEACERIDDSVDIDEWVTPDPGCAYTLREAGLKARSVVEFLADNVEAFENVAEGARVYYHDACYLGRHAGVYDGPRALIKSATGQPAQEFAMCKEHADCSGGGGLYPVANIDGATSVAKKRLEGIDGVVVTACPSARAMLTRAGGTAIEISELLLGENDG